MLLQFQTIEIYSPILLVPQYTKNKQKIISSAAVLFLKCKNDEKKEKYGNNHFMLHCLIIIKKI
jgi:hypothetical protein